VKEIGMELETIRIQRNPSYHDRPSDYTGKVKYKGDHGEVEINLNAETSRRVLDVVAAQLVETTKELAQNITADTLTAKPALLTEQA
jgi:hypothetical protein